MSPIKKSLKNNQPNKCNTKKQNQNTKMPFRQSLFIPCTAFFPSQRCYDSLCYEVAMVPGCVRAELCYAKTCRSAFSFLDLLKQY